MLKPIKLKVLIKPDNKKLTTEAGLQMVNYSLEGGLRRGTVVAVGDQVRDVKEGDRVCYEVFEGSLLTHENIEYALMYETQIIGRLEDELPM